MDVAKEEMLEQRRSLVAHLKLCINQSHRAYIPSAKYPVSYVECPLAHKGNNLPHIRLQDISQTKTIYCSRSDGKIVPPQAYMMLLTADTGK